MFYVLHDNKGGCLGVFDSFDSLKVGVDFWTNDCKDVTLLYSERECNSTNLYGWDFAYINPEEDVTYLADTGGLVPFKKFWGMNLINIEYKSGFIDDNGNYLDYDNCELIPESEMI